MGHFEYRFKLETGSRKQLCPNCGKKRFKRYIDVSSDQYIHQNVGLCDRIESCGYHLPPKAHLQLLDAISPVWRPYHLVPSKTPKQKPGRLPLSLVDNTLKRYKENSLIHWLSSLPGWDFELASQTARLYRVGTGSSKSVVNGWPIFWQIDNMGEVRSGKLIRYNRKTGKRIKSEGFNCTWIHNLLIKTGQLPDNQKKWSLQQCLFGLHLIDSVQKRPIAIVESEKTALVASQYIPSFVWLACGSISELKQEKLNPLKGLQIILYPDKGVAYEKWVKVAYTLNGFATIYVSDLLEVHAPDEHDGYDIADYLCQYDIRRFPGSTQYNPEGIKDGRYTSTGSWQSSTKSK